MLPCVCSVVDHSWRQNVVRTKMWRTRRSRVCHWCSYHILTSTVVYYWTNVRQHGIYLFYIITERSLFKIKIFQHNAKASLCPAFAHFGEDKNAIWRTRFYWLLRVANNCDWSRKITPPSNLNRTSLLVEWAKPMSQSGIDPRNLKILKEMLKISFCHQSSPVSRKAWTLPWKLQKFKKYRRKTYGCGQPRGH